MLKWHQKLRQLHRAWRYRLRTEREEIALVRSVIQPGDLVLDIGAHKAAFTYWMAKAVGTRGKVFGFEPIPDLANYLRRVAHWLASSNYTIEIHECALSNTTGKSTLFFPGEHLGSASLEKTNSVMQDPFEVTTFRLDDLLGSHRPGQPIFFIKCDVENHELAVFQGAQQTLQSDCPILLFESGNLMDGMDFCRPTFEFLNSLGYRGFFFHDSGLVAIDDFDPSRHRAPAGENQNFVFSHPDAIQWQSHCVPFRVRRLAVRHADAA